MSGRPRIEATSVSISTGRPRELARFYAALLGVEVADQEGPRKGEPEDEAMDASSVLSLMSLGAGQGDKVVLRAEGAGADDALRRASIVRIASSEKTADATKTRCGRPATTRSFTSEPLTPTRASTTEAARCALAAASTSEPDSTLTTRPPLARARASNNSVFTAASPKR